MSPQIYIITHKYISYIFMNNQPNKLTFKALESAVYCPPYTYENSIDSLTIDKFNSDQIKQHIKGSVPLLSYNTTYIPIMIDILDILYQYKNNFLIDDQKYISFYWSGILIYRITINKKVSHEKQLHIKLQKYKTEKENITVDNNTNRFLIFLGGASLIIGTIVVGFSLFKYFNPIEITHNHYP